MACFLKDHEIVQALLKQKDALTQVNHQQRYGGYTPLMCAVIKNDATLVRMLLNVPGIDTFLKSNTGFTALDFAKRKPIKHIQDLIENKQKRL